MQNSIPQEALNELFYVEFSNGGSAFITFQKFQELTESLKTKVLPGSVTNIAKVKSLSDQKVNLDSLVFELKSATSILQSLVNQAFLLDENSQQYIELMNNISYFIHRDIIEVARRKVSELNSVMEYEEDLKKESKC